MTRRPDVVLVEIEGEARVGEVLKAALAAGAQVMEVVAAAGDAGGPLPEESPLITMGPRAAPNPGLLRRPDRAQW